MTVRELIEALEAIAAEHGDHLPVRSCESPDHGEPWWGPPEHPVVWECEPGNVPDGEESETHYRIEGATVGLKVVLLR